MGKIKKKPNLKKVERETSYTEKVSSATLGMKAATILVLLTYILGGHQIHREPLNQPAESTSNSSVSQSPRPLHQSWAFGKSYSRAKE